MVIEAGEVPSAERNDVNPTEPLIPSIFSAAPTRGDLWSRPVTGVIRGIEYAAIPALSSGLAQIESCQVPANLSCVNLLWAHGLDHHAAAGAANEVAQMTNAHKIALTRIFIFPLESLVSRLRHSRSSTTTSPYCPLFRAKRNMERRRTVAAARLAQPPPTMATRWGGVEGADIASIAVYLSR